LVVIFSLLLVATSESVAVGDLLNAPNRPVLVDSNVVGDLRKDPTLGGRIGPDETPVISYVTGPELRNAASKSDKFFVPKNLDDLDVLPTRPSLDTRINIRGQSNRAKGKFGDGIIGGQAVDGNVPLITNDKELKKIVNGLGGEAR